MVNEQRIRKDIKALKSKSVAISSAAEKRLAKRGEAAVQLLAPFTKSKNAVIRHRVAWVLGLSGQRSAIPVLKLLLKDRNQYVSYDSRAALSEIKEKSAARIVYRLFCDLPEDKRHGANLALHGLHSKDYLLRMLRSQNDSVFLIAVYMAAANRHTRKTVEALLQSGDQEIRDLAKDALS